MDDERTKIMNEMFMRDAIHNRAHKIGHELNQLHRAVFAFYGPNIAVCDKLHLLDRQIRLMEEEAATLNRLVAGIPKQPLWSKCDED